MTTIAVDAMGGDDAPGAEIAGSVAAVRETDVSVVLVGDHSAVQRHLDSLSAKWEGEDTSALSRISVRHADERVTMSDNPARVFRAKPDSSMRVAFDLVKSGAADAVVSAGNSGAMLSHGLFVLGRIDGIERPCIVSVLPGAPGTAGLVLCDTGANSEPRASTLAQFGLLGAHYDRLAHGHDRPRVGLLSNGSESSKGTVLTRAADTILERMARHDDARFEYLGYVEASELFRGHIDVVATDGFTGNVVLKLAEGLGEALLSMAERELGQRNMTHGATADVLHAMRRSVDYRERGGALLGGVKGVVMICHGRSDSSAIKNAIHAADSEARGNLVASLTSAVERYRSLWSGGMASESDAQSA